MIDGLTEAERLKLWLVNYSIDYNEYVGMVYIHWVLPDGHPQKGVTRWPPFYTHREAFNFLMREINEGKA